MKPSSGFDASGPASGSGAEKAGACFAIAFPMRSSSSSRSVTGFVTKSSAPSFIASTASSISPKAVTRMQAIDGETRRAAFTSSRPFIPGIL